jgi:hypothetical protein
MKIRLRDGLPYVAEGHNGSAQCDTRALDVSLEDLVVEEGRT